METILKWQIQVQLGTWYSLEVPLENAEERCFVERALPWQNHNAQLPRKSRRWQEDPLQRGQEDSGYERVGGPGG